MRGRLSGRSDGDLVASLSKALEEAGLGGDEAKRAAKGVIGEEGKKLDNDIARGLMEPRKMAAPQIHDAVSMLANVQAKVGGEDQQKTQTKLLERLVDGQRQSEKAIVKVLGQPRRARLAP